MGGEAFWSVAPELAQYPFSAWALENHYGKTADMRSFFTEVLRVRPELTHADFTRLLRNSNTRSGSPDSNQGNVQEGLELTVDFATADSDPAHANFNIDQALASALQLAQQCRPPAEGEEDGHTAECESTALQTPAAPRSWRRVGQIGSLQVFAVEGMEGPTLQDSQYARWHASILVQLCSAFGLHPSQIAFAHDPSGRCVCERRLFVDADRLPRAAQLPTREAAITFWATELARAIAH